MDDEAFYSFDFNGDYDSYSRMKIIDTPLANDELTKSEASTKVKEATKEAITASDVFNWLSAYALTANSDYALKIAGEDKDLLRVSFTGYTEGFWKASYELVANFDFAYKLKAISMSKLSYEDEDWDTTSHAPKSGTSAYSTSKAAIVSITYGDLSDDFALPLTEEEAKGLWITSLSNVIAFSNTRSGGDSADNAPEAGRAIYLNTANDKPDNPYTYLPSTAVDSSTVDIIGSSDSSIVYISEIGVAAVAADAAGKTCTLAVGNSFCHTTIEVTIAKNTDPNVPLFEGEGDDFALLDDTKGSITFDTYYNYSIKLNSLNDTAIIKGTTTNKGPFDKGLSLGEGIDSAYFTIDLLSDQSTYLTKYGSNGVYFAITLIKDPSSIIYFNLTCQGTSQTGGGVLEDQALPFTIDLA